MRKKPEGPEPARAPSVLRTTVLATGAWFLILLTLALGAGWPLEILWLTPAAPITVLAASAWQEWGLQQLSIAAMERKLLIDINRDGHIGHPPDFTVTIQNKGGQRLTIFDGRKAPADAVAAALVAHHNGLINWSTRGVRRYLKRHEFEELCEWLEAEGWLVTKEGKGRSWTPEGEAFLAMVAERYG